MLVPSLPVSTVTALVLGAGVAEVVFFAVVNHPVVVISGFSFRNWGFE